MELKKKNVCIRVWKPKTDLKPCRLQDDLWGGVEGSVTTPALDGTHLLQARSCSSLSLQALVQRLSYQPEAKSSIWNMAIWAFKKAHGVTECRKKKQHEECGDGEWFPVSTQLSLRAPPFCVSWRAAACLWIAKALSQLLGAGPEGRGGRGAEPALHSSWLGRHV